MRRGFRLGRCWLAPTMPTTARAAAGRRWSRARRRRLGRAPAAAVVAFTGRSAAATTRATLASLSLGCCRAASNALVSLCVLWLVCVVITELGTKVVAAPAVKEGSRVCCPVAAPGGVNSFVKEGTRLRRNFGIVTKKHSRSPDACAMHAHTISLTRTQAYRERPSCRPQSAVGGPTSRSQARAHSHALRENSRPRAGDRRAPRACARVRLRIARASRSPDKCRRSVSR